VWTLGLAATLWTSCASVDLPRQAPESARAAAVAEIVGEPARFADLRVTVKGRLIAEGNYFSRQSKLFVLDEGGRRLEVQPWLPKSAPPPRGDADPVRTQADFLDHQVELTGVLRVGAAGNPPPGIRLEVTSARIVTP
jgi:hypothetical protein